MNKKPLQEEVKDQHMIKDNCDLIFLYWDEPVYNRDKPSKLKINKNDRTKSSTNRKKSINKKKGA